MAAIVTDNFRRNNAKFFFNDFSNVDTNYYVGIGKSDKWAIDEEALLPGDIPIPLGIPNDETDIKSNLITLLKINSTNVNRVIPHIKWKVGEFYKAYDSLNDKCFYPSAIEGGKELNPCYAVVSGRIYLCLQAGNSTVSDIPNSTDYRAIRGTDGYVWVLIDSVTASTSNIVTDQFINIASGVAASTTASAIRNDGGGLLYSFTVKDGGSGYSSNSVTFFARDTAGLERSFECPITVNSNTGAIEKVLLPTAWSFTDVNSKNIVDGYFRFFDSETGNGAVIVANIAPLNGFAYEPAAILPSWFIGISVDAADDISSDGLYIPYRQISILKGISKIEGASVDTLAATRYLTLSAAPNFTPRTGDTIFFGTTGKKAYIDSYNTVNLNGSTVRRLYFHQNSTTGYGVIPSSGIATTSSGGNINYSSVSDNEYIHGSGQVIFTENRKSINRQSGQTEEIKIIIQF